MSESIFNVRVAKEDFKFNAGHFVAYKGFRERLHGHNYKVALRVFGTRHIMNDGYVLDFGDVKKACRKVCKRINEYFLCPMYCDVMEVRELFLDNNSQGSKGEPYIQLKVLDDDSIFLFPKKDCVLLPVAHVTTEELSIYLWGEIVKELGDPSRLLKRGIRKIEITVSEALGQESSFIQEVPPTTEEIDVLCDVRTYIMKDDEEECATSSNPGVIYESDSTLSVSQWEQKQQLRDDIQKCVIQEEKKEENCIDQTDFSTKLLSLLSKMKNTMDAQGQEKLYSFADFEASIHQHMNSLDLNN